MNMTGFVPSRGALQSIHQKSATHLSIKITDQIFLLYTALLRPPPGVEEFFGRGYNFYFIGLVSVHTCNYVKSLHNYYCVV